jgi:hypothetical protein
MSKRKGKSAARIAAAAGMAVVVGAANAITIDGPEGVGDLVWEDVNGNGIQDGGEPGLANVTVNLLRESDLTLLDTTMTDAMGNYGFSWDNQAFGTPYYQLFDFVVEFELLPGYVFTVQNAPGSTDNNDSDADTSTGRAAVTINGPDEINYNIDAGMILDAQIPIPAAVWLFGSGLLGLVAVARRKKSS